LNLPHGDFLKFAQKLISKEDTKINVYCVFTSIPTLGAFIEAAAQSSSAFEVKNDAKPKVGFLISTKNITLENEITQKEYIFKLTKNIEINTMKQFSFDAFAKIDDTKVVSGIFTILVQE